MWTGNNKVLICCIISWCTVNNKLGYIYLKIGFFFKLEIGDCFSLDSACNIFIHSILHLAASISIQRRRLLIANKLFADYKFTSNQKYALAIDSFSLAIDSFSLFSCLCVSLSMLDITQLTASLCFHVYVYHYPCLI